MAPLTYSKLWKWNLGVGIFQLVTAVLLFAITGETLLSMREVHVRLRFRRLSLDKAPLCV